MVSDYTELAYILILLTITTSLIIGRSIPRESMRGIDGILAILGFIFGLFMTFMNLIYVSDELFLLSPAIALSCVIYLRYQSNIKDKPHDSFMLISNRHNTILNITWWFLIGAALVTYKFSEIYTRKPLYFVLVSGTVAILAIQIIMCNTDEIPNTKKSLIFIVKILLISTILRYSAYYISSYPVGSDPWAHREYISYFLEYGQITVPSGVHYYYVHYPISHLHAVCTTLIGAISPFDAMFILSMILTLSTIVAFMIVKMLSGDTQIALTSVLLLNFTDVHIQWSIQVIAMSFGIAIYSFIIYFALNRYQNPSCGPIYTSFFLIFLIIIVWTHTISTFVALVSLLALVAGSFLYETIYNRSWSSIWSRNNLILLDPIIILVIVAWIQWTNPSYPFFEGCFINLVSSLSQEAEFLGAISFSNVTGTWAELLKPLGFCIYAFFGVVGTLYCSSNKDMANKYFPLIILVLVLFVFRYAFPILGIRNIIPDRWPAFAFICFAPLISIGVFCGLSVLKTKKTKNAIFCAVTIYFFVGTFFMITNASVNQDSPLWGEKVCLKLIWSESEMKMYAHINDVYNGTIISDEHTHTRPFATYLKSKKSVPYHLSPSGTIDKELLSSGLIVWRRESLNRPEHIRDSRGYVTMILLGDKFWEYLDNNYNCISDTHSARSYLSC